MAESWLDIETRREREMWQRFAFLAAHVINISGKTARRTVKPEHLIRLGDDAKRMSDDDREQRKREAIETLRQHKAKFWTKFKDENVASITGDPNG